MERQFTATAYVIQQQRVLLILHRKLKKWLPPGGHMSTNETPPEAARREVFEETGLHIEFISQENIWIERWNANSFERPFLCLLEEIPSFGNTPAHQHIDFIYLARPIGGIEQHCQDEVDGMRWFSIDEIDELVPDKDIFAETQQVIRSILDSNAQLHNLDLTFRRSYKDRSGS